MEPFPGFFFKIKPCYNHTIVINIYLVLHISHLHQLDPLADSGVVPEVDEHVGVEGEHETERDHKDCQEYHSEVGFLHCL